MILPFLQWIHSDQPQPSKHRQSSFKDLSLSLCIGPRGFVHSCNFLMDRTLQIPSREIVPILMFSLFSLEPPMFAWKFVISTVKRLADVTKKDTSFPNGIAGHIDTCNGFTTVIHFLKGNFWPIFGYFNEVPPVFSWTVNGWSTLPLSRRFCLSLELPNTQKSESWDKPACLFFPPKDPQQNIPQTESQTGKQLLSEKPRTECRISGKKRYTFPGKEASRSVWEKIRWLLRQQIGLFYFPHWQMLPIFFVGRTTGRLIRRFS